MRPYGPLACTSFWRVIREQAPPGTPSMIDFYRYLAPKLQVTYVFNGDTDPCVSYEVRHAKAAFCPASHVSNARIQLSDVCAGERRQNNIFSERVYSNAHSSTLLQS
jgi:hypothetical protein